MSLKTQYEFLFVGKDDGSFVENYAYDLGDGATNSGKLFINFEIQNNPIDAENIGEMIFDVLRKVFYFDLEKDPYIRFEEAVKAVNRSLNQLREEKSKYISNIHALIAAVVENNLYLTQCGDAEAYLIRKRLCTNISDGLSEEGVNDIFTNIASGSLENEDFVLLNSTRLLRYISKNDLAKICSGKNLVSVLSELKDFLSTEVLNKIGLIGLKITEEVAFNSSEKGKIVAHLEKEEVVSFDSEKKAKSVSDNSLKKILISLVSQIRYLQQRLLQSTEKTANIGRGMRSVGSQARGLVKGNWSRDKILAGIIILVVVLAVGIWWLKSRAAEQEIIAGYDRILKEISEEIASAETTGQYNKSQAGQMLIHAREQAMQVLNSRYYSAKANEMLQKINDSWEKIDKVQHPEAKLLVDLSTKRNNVSALGLLGNKGGMFAYEYNALYSIVLDKLMDPFTIDDNEKVISGGIYDDKQSLMFLTQSGRVIEVKDGRTAFMDSTDGQFHKGTVIKGYGNRIYILDALNNAIWKYTRRRDKFDSAEQYNTGGTDIKKGVDIAIDGNVYVLNSDGTIAKFYGGNAVAYKIKNAPENPITAPTRIFTQLDMPQLYMLEPSKNRILVFNKDDGQGNYSYQTQYVFDDLKDLRDIYVDKDTNKIYMLDVNKVYTVTL